jgi:hypothetical protein
MFGPATGYTGRTSGNKKQFSKQFKIQKLWEQFSKEPMEASPARPEVWWEVAGGRSIISRACQNEIPGTTGATGKVCHGGKVLYTIRKLQLDGFDFRFTTIFGFSKA